MTTASALLADQRARMLATAVAEHTDTTDLADPNGDQARGIDPDTAGDQYREDTL